MIKLSVLIPTHGRPTLLGRTLESLSKCDIPKGYAETVVIENGPKSGAEAVVGGAAVDYPHLNLRHMHVERANKSHALNEALKTIQDGLVVFFDDDIRMDANILIAYAEAASEQEDGAYFGGPMGSDFETPPPDWLLPLLPASVRGFTLADAAEAGYYLGANWAAFVRDLHAVGGFDPNFGPGSPTGARGQENEMQRRLRRASISAVDVAGAMVWHYVPANRCSPQWTITRTYQTGLHRGVQVSSGEGTRMTRTGMKAIPRGAFRYLVAAAGRQQARRLEAKADLAFWIGYFRGFLTQIR